MRSLLISITIFVAGCAGLTYVEPTVGDRARVRFVTESPDPTVLRVYDGPDCSGEEHEWMRLRVGTLLTSSPKRLGMPLWNYHENAAKEVYVHTDKPMTAIFWGTELAMGYGGGMHYSCGVPFTAAFQKGKDYEVKLVWNRTACDVVFSEITPEDGGSHSFKVLKKFTNSASENTQGCLKHFKRFRLD
jgi:hypothetical protein